VGLDSFGRRVQFELARGVYKRRPNSVILPNGERHEYCPPEHVDAEMDRLISLYHALPKEFPEVRAAWLHHAFTQIHPFEDGNGRVARALASIDFIRARMFPVVIERQQRDDTYVPALIAADKGNLSDLVALFTSRQERAVRRAISEADALTSHALTLDAALDVAQQKIGRRNATAKNAHIVSGERLRSLTEVAATQLETTRRRIEAKVPGVRVSVLKKEARSAHYWREQIVQEAKRGEYWADLQEPWEWVHLKLTNGGMTSFVVVLHFVGNPTPGSAAAVAFVTHRSNDDKNSVLDAPRLSVEPLMLYPEEAEKAQRRRFLDWLAKATSEAVTVWTRYL
jgi:fido (protein-threonine AMPylation protein)